MTCVCRACVASQCVVFFLMHRVRPLHFRRRALPCMLACLHAQEMILERHFSANARARQLSRSFFSSTTTIR